MSLLFTWIGRASATDSAGGAAVLQSISISPSPGVVFVFGPGPSGQNIAQFTATGSFSDASTSDITALATWSNTSDETILANDGGGVYFIADAGKIWGGQVDITATLAPGTPGTASVIVVASDSGTVAPRMPQSDVQWQALGLSPWGAYGGLQEVTASLVLSGSAAYTLTFVGAGGAGDPFVYRQTIPGWTRKGIEMKDVATGARFRAAAGTGPNGTATPFAMLWYGTVVRTGNTSRYMGGLNINGTATQRIALRTDASAFGGVDLNARNSFKGMIHSRGTYYDDRIHPFLMVYDPATGDLHAYSDLGIATTGSVADLFLDGEKGLGAPSNNATCSASFTYFASCTGSVALALMNPSGAADFLQNMGWNVPWHTAQDSASIKMPFLPYHYRNLGLDPWQSSWPLSAASGTYYSDDEWPFTALSFRLLAVGEVKHDQPAANWIKGSPATIRESTADRLTISQTSAVQNLNPFTSYAAIAYVSCSYSTANLRSMFGFYGSANGGRFSAMMNTAGTLTLIGSGSNAGTTANDYRTGRFHPVLIVNDVSTGRHKLYTDLEVITGSSTGQTAGQYGLFSIQGTPTSFCGQIAYTAVCTGSTAEALSDDGRASDYLKRLGWNVSW